MHKGQLLLLLLLLLLHRSFGIAIENNQCTTFWGELMNISYPFRLRGDPKVSGDPNYELACINKRTILDLYPGKYHVRCIDYANYTIGIVDAGLRKDNCSSFPLRSLSCGNFGYNTDRYRCGQYTYLGPRLSKFLTIVSCMKAIDPRFYVDTSSCLNRVKFSNFSNMSRQIYAMIDANVSSVEAVCTLELAMIPWWIDGNNCVRIPCRMTGVQRPTKWIGRANVSYSICFIVRFIMKN